MISLGWIFLVFRHRVWNLLSERISFTHLARVRICWVPIQLQRLSCRQPHVILYRRTALTYLLCRHLCMQTFQIQQRLSHQQPQMISYRRTLLTRLPRRHLCIQPFQLHRLSSRQPQVILKSVRATKNRTPIAYYQKGLTAHTKAIILRVPMMKTHLARRNGTQIQTKKGKVIKGGSNTILEHLLATYYDIFTLAI